LRKLTIEYLKEYIESKDYKLLSKEYVNSKTKLELQCPKWHKFEMIWNNFYTGQRCPQCGGTKKLLYKDVKVFIESKDYKLLEKVYKNNHTKMKMQCPEGHKFKMTWNNFYTGHRCPECAGLKKFPIQDIKRKIEKIKGYKLLEKEYVNSITKMKMECPEGHIFWMTWGSFKQKHRCPECANNQRNEYEDIKRKIEKIKGYKLLEKEYVNAHTKMKMECPEGHIFWIRWNDFQQGIRCSECFRLKSFSKGEKEVLEYIQSITDTTIISNDRTQIINPKTGCNLELDIFLPQIKKAIEYNGTYWHSSDKAIYKDYQKVIQCEKLGIDLMVIEEKNWVNDKDVYKKMIIKILGEA